MPQHENGDIYVAEEYFCIKFSSFIQHYISSLLCIILLYLLNVWRSDAASKSMFDFR